MTKTLFSHFHLEQNIHFEKCSHVLTFYLLCLSIMKQLHTAGIQMLQPFTIKTFRLIELNLFVYKL